MPDTLTSAQAAWFEEQLRHSYPKVLAASMPELSSFRLFETDTSPPPGAEEWAQDYMTQFGQARVSNLQSKDAPKVNVGMNRELGRLRAVDAAFEYTQKEILAAQMSGNSLQPLRQTAARDAILRKMDDVNWDGDEDFALHGVLTIPYISRRAIANPITDATAPDVILRNLLDFLLSIRTLTHGEVTPDTLVMPTAAYGHIASEPISTTVPTSTILSVLTQNYAGFASLTVTSSWRLDASGDILCYSKGQAKQRVIVPGGQLFNMLEPTRQGPVYEVYCYGLTGGFATNYPLEMSVGLVP